MFVLLKMCLPQAAAMHDLLIDDDRILVSAPVVTVAGAIAVTVAIALMHDGFYSLHSRHLAVRRQRLGDDLIHVVVLVRREPADEVYLGRSIGQCFVLRV